MKAKKPKDNKIAVTSLNTLAKEYGVRMFVLVLIAKRSSIPIFTHKHYPERMEYQRPTFLHFAELMRTA